MYHVLIFQQAGKYLLDSVAEASEGSEGSGVHFSSLDELVLFLTGHNLKVGEDEIKLTEACPFLDDSIRMSSNCTLADQVQHSCSGHSDLLPPSCEQSEGQ